VRRFSIPLLEAELIEGMASSSCFPLSAAVGVVVASEVDVMAIALQ
jgi:hypothetical protein